MKPESLKQVFRVRNIVAAIDRKEFSGACEALLENLGQLSTEEHYALVLLLQSERLHDDELFYFSNAKAWQTSKRIVDLGCGPAFSLSFLRDYFPQKNFTGVEISPVFAAMAAEAGINTVEADISTYRPSEQFDFGLVKAVLQHMPDDSLLLENLKEIIRPNGYLLVHDAHPDHKSSSMTFNPTVRTLEQMYSDVEKHQAGRRFAIRSFVDRATQAGWEIRHSGDSGVAVGKEVEKLNFAKEEVVRSALIAKLLGPSVSPSELHAELKTWLQSPNSFAVSVGLRVLLQRKS